MDAKVKEQIFKIFPNVVFILFIIVVIYIGIVTKNEPTKFHVSEEVTSNDTLVIEGIGEVSTPFHIEARKGTKYVVKDVIPSNVKDGYYMMFYSDFSKQRVLVGDVFLGSYGERRRLTHVNLIGNIRVLIPLKKWMAGKEVTIAFTPYYDQGYDYVAPVYGPADAILASVIGDNIGRIFIMIMIFTQFTIAAMLALFMRFTESSLNIKSISYYAFFLCAVLCWIFFSSDVPQFFTNANVVVSFASFLSLTLMGIAFNGFCEQTFEEFGRIFSNLRFAGWFLPLINVGAFLIGIADPMILMPLTHLYYVITAIVCLFAIFSNWKKPESRIISCSIVIMIVACLIGLVLQYTMPTTGRTGFVIGLGLLLFSLGLMGTIIKRITSLVESDNNYNAFREMAYEDVMTGLGNRSKFEKFFDDVDGMGIEGKSVTLFMFDLNFLKKVNDECGHNAGDQMIIGLAKCIEKSFDKLGTAYRLGGDEFAAIVVGHADKVLNIIEDFKKSIDNYNKYNEHGISTAIGYSTRKYRHGEPDFYNRLFREADEAMYANKVRMHEELGEEVRNTKRN